MCPCYFQTGYWLSNTRVNKNSSESICFEIYRVRTQMLGKISRNFPWCFKGVVTFFQGFWICEPSYFNYSTIHNIPVRILKLCHFSRGRHRIQCDYGRSRAEGYSWNVLCSGWWIHQAVWQHTQDHQVHYTISSGALHKIIRSCRSQIWFTHILFMTQIFGNSRALSLILPKYFDT